MSNVIKYEKMLFSKYIEQKEIKKSILSISDKLNHEYKNKNLQIIGLLDGCVQTLNELTKHLKINYCIYNIKVSSYEGINRGKILFKDYVKFDQINAKDDILIVDDIVDSGNTIKSVRKLINDSISNDNIKIYSLLTKKETLHLCDWYSFIIPDKYVIGFGMDINNLFRDLNDIYIMKENDAEEK